MIRTEVADCTLCKQATLVLMQGQDQHGLATLVLMPLWSSYTGSLLAASPPTKPCMPINDIMRAHQLTIPTLLTFLQRP